VKKTIFVHIGRPKVGLIAIQRFFKTNRKVLLENGVLYPVCGERQNASYQLAEVLLEGEKPIDFPSAKICIRS
jgi:hypothetical protein